MELWDYKVRAYLKGIFKCDTDSIPPIYSVQVTEYEWTLLRRSVTKTRPRCAEILLVRL